MIPVSIVTGFLGSGKTTLIGRILRDPAFARTAVVVNEFGAVGLDHALIAAGNERLMTLSTGCLCCAMQGDLSRTLRGLRDAAPGGYDRVLVETSGLADPAPVLHALMTDPDLARDHALDTVLTVIDSVLGEATLRAHPEAERQAALADVLAFSKRDVAAPSPGLHALLEALNPTAERAGTDTLAGTALFAASDPERRAARLRHLGDGSPAAARHTGGVESFILEREAPIPAVALTLLLEALAEHCGPRLLRLKGLVALAEAPERPAVVHGVQHVLAPVELLPRWPGPDRVSCLVFITRGVPRHFPVRLLEIIEAELPDAAA